MSKPMYNDQTITQYLLGALPATEAERLDELSFTDEDFAATLKAAENDLVDAYVQGELTGDALAQFESYYLASPRRREKVRFAQAFQTLAEKKAVGRAGEAATENPVPATTGRKGFGRFSAWRTL